jgi:hypothetical protein
LIATGREVGTVNLAQNVREIEGSEEVIYSTFTLIF